MKLFDFTTWTYLRVEEIYAGLLGEGGLVPPMGLFWDCASPDDFCGAAIRQRHCECDERQHGF